MDLETKFKKETGFDAYADNDLRPKVPSDYYVEWLEEQLALTDVSTRTWCVEIGQNGWEYTGYANIKCKECKKIDDKKVLVDGIEIEFDEEINEPYVC